MGNKTIPADMAAIVPLADHICVWTLKYAFLGIDQRPLRSSDDLLLGGVAPWNRKI